MKKESERLIDFQDAMQGIVSKDFTNWLVGNGFFTAPASTKFHGNYDGGLFDHSLEVMECLVEMTAKLGAEWQRKESPFIVGMFHDLCKTDEYIKVVDVEGTVIMGMDEVKGEETHYEHSPDVVLKGHGDKSIMLLSQFMTLTEEEMLCIRYHMGAYEGQQAWDGYDKAIRKYPSVLFTHTADMYASKVRNV
jgi:23S rRNA maturation-related 3'-5' exoribonuclease YhaM